MKNAACITTWSISTKSRKAEGSNSPGAIAVALSWDTFSVEAMPVGHSEMAALLLQGLELIFNWGVGP